jgi:uncharacterized damage-inducible protein DinB
MEDDRAGMPHERMIDEYLVGTALLDQVVGDLTDDQLDATPIAGKWTIRQVVCHISDFEPIYADRMKRVIVESLPHFQGGDPSMFAARLAYKTRRVRHELDVVSAVRVQMASILRSLHPDDFSRSGLHPKDGEITLEVLLKRITQHVSHHVRFIQEKRQALGL